MSLARPTLLSCLTAALLTCSAVAGDSLDGYLTKDGKLAQTLEIRDVQGGFAGFTGTSFKVEPDGKWTSARVMNQKSSDEKTGTLSAEELTTLAKALAKYDALNLKASGKPMTNPHVITVKFGKVDATLNLPTGTTPKVDPKADKFSVEERYAGIVLTVREMVVKKEDKK